ncbi:rab11 family-interacting protein 3 [Thalassophryne amazonica]|uniref:rab11 family-interacting protein 3 n=1 Tax=Thalassophryne amazonica TaxID=390379 RepID=UPI001471F219|nr:rab11 family-interacting protein 3 [Thalassophryne amazonica]
MEAVALSGPLGHREQESEETFPFGFRTLDLDVGGVFCQNTSGQTGLDVENVDQNQRSTHSNIDKDFQNKMLNLDNLIMISDDSCGDLYTEGAQTVNSEGSLHSIDELCYAEKTQVPDGIIDCGLSLLFSSNLSDVVRESSAGEEQNQVQEVSFDDSDAPAQFELITLSVPSSPSKLSERTPESDTGGLFLLVDVLSREHSLSCFIPQSSSEVILHGVSEELAIQSQEDASLSPSQGGETLSPETRGKGFFPDQVTDLPMGSTTTLQGLSENYTQHNHISTPLEYLDTSVPLLDLEVPDYDDSPSLCPTSPVSVICTGALLDSAAEELDLECAGANLLTNVVSEHQNEQDSFALDLSPEISLVTAAQAEDAFSPGDFTSQSSVKKESKDLLEGELCSEVNNQGNVTVALDLCLATEDIRDEETWDVKHLEDVQDKSNPHSQTGQRDEDRSSDTDQLAQLDCHKLASFDFPVQELNSSFEPQWTSDQTMETISLSKMVVDDSLPVVSAATMREEDVSPLKPVFDALDQDGDGFVRIEEFMEFAAAYGADQVKDFAKFLDPSGLGVISFEDFHRGISAISSGGPEPQLYKVNYSPGDGAAGCPEEYDEQNEVTDSAYLGSESTYSECETFTDEDTGVLVPPEMHEDVETDSGIEATLHDHDDGSSRSVKDFAKFLDPSGLGVISFEDFHRGISAISSGGPEPQLYKVNYSPGDGAAGCPEEYDEQNEVTDSAYLGSESTYSECETFTDEDTGVLVPPEMHEDVETDSGIEATLHDHDDGSSRFLLNSELHNHSLVTVIGGEEEHFEDFGESNTSELLLESTEGSPRAGDSSLSPNPEQVDGPSLLSPSASAPIPDCFQSFLREEALDFFCSQCHKQISRLEDLSTRLTFLEMTSAGKRLSSKKVARHLLQNSSMTLDTMSDLTRDILELADNDITDKVLLLERRVAELEKESEASGEQHARLRQENLQLVHRANAFEEQLKEQELHADDQLQQETRRHKEVLSKLERERGLELENLQARLQQLDEENSELRSCVPCLRANIERLEEEKMKLQDEMEALTSRLTEEVDSRRKMADRLSHERHQNHKEKECTQELIEDLRKQLEHLQLYKLEAEAKRGRSPGAGLQEYQTRTREAELEHEIKRLKQDNRTLKEQNDELNGQIINLSIQGAKNLMSASFSDSLAAEINSVSRAELMEAVHKQEEINYRLQDYIDKIIVAIMESNPSILEVK